MCERFFFFSTFLPPSFSLSLYLLEIIFLTVFLPRSRKTLLLHILGRRSISRHRSAGCEAEAPGFQCVPRARERKRGAWEGGRERGNHDVSTAATAENSRRHTPHPRFPHLFLLDALHTANVRECARLVFLLARLFSLAGRSIRHTGESVIRGSEKTWDTTDRGGKRLRSIGDFTRTHFSIWKTGAIAEGWINREKRNGSRDDIRAVTCLHIYVYIYIYT